jgi:molybdopterin/thiamine biosynthesis adenylyltransferase/proteasome lid subunit RPN8/RPN11
MTTTLVLTDQLAAELLHAARGEVETAGVLLARRLDTPDGQLRLLGRSIHWVPEHAYLRRERDGLTISSDGYVPALDAAEQDRAVAIWVHTHPGDGASPRPSRHDLVVDAELADLFRLRADSELYGALVVAHRCDQLRFAGHLETADNRFDLDRIWITGRRLALLPNALQPSHAIPDAFDRNIRAFGSDIQHVLANLQIAIVGNGGTGSAVAEQLIRLGARRLALYDPDTLSESNVTRVYGSTPQDVGQLKSDILARHLRRIANDASITAHTHSITRQETAVHLAEADLVFGCTDDNAGRLILSRLATYLLTPVIDCGVLLSSGPNGRLEGIDGRVTLLAPGAACLVCRDRVDLPRAAAELLEPAEHARLAGEGYAPALDGIEPAVVAYTTQVAAAAVGELLERLIGYGPPTPASEVLLRIHEREISTNDAEPRERHYCHPASGKLGLGDTEPFLEQTWQ